jgi:hypothetical protein
VGTVDSRSSVASFAPLKTNSCFYDSQRPASTRPAWPVNNERVEVELIGICFCCSTYAVIVLIDIWFCYNTYLEVALIDICFGCSTYVAVELIRICFCYHTASCSSQMRSRPLDI